MPPASAFLITESYRYDEIVNLYVGHLVYVWVEDPTEATCANVEKKIDSFAEGNLEHATEMLSAFWKTISKDEGVKALPETPPPVSPLLVSALSCAERGCLFLLPNKSWEPVPPTYWKSTKIALINSIRKGVFFDRKYWAKHSNAGQVLKPVYFSNTIMNDKAQQLDKRTSKIVCWCSNRSTEYW